MICKTEKDTVHLMPSLCFFEMSLLLNIGGCITLYMVYNYLLISYYYCHVLLCLRNTIRSFLINWWTHWWSFLVRIQFLLLFNSWIPSLAHVQDSTNLFLLCGFILITMVPVLSPCSHRPPEAGEGGSHLSPAEAYQHRWVPLLTSSHARTHTPHHLLHSVLCTLGYIYTAFCAQQIKVKK